ncbi:MAG TPA: hypothetical protein PKL69_08670 [Agitococcus sp.]|uniref:Uncharacterized protein n=1 Tax=Agitococcus lubricus TaxID=1077255 RepID=A0A2T5IX94_9GAMM|nr:hypothetical protein [Agitococcus lubricus]PTQ88575.1 hypothetical protein C8N29_11198 [Agitococcus lubricus]HMU88431.1 hypothetical protein [Agitococcus sp.]HNJ87490.1 hypothetical protein [Agitococcus sp.]HNL80398.1 hypothetical protein [Agitococcus sp.]
MKIHQLKKVNTLGFRILRAQHYTCEYCGGHHRSRCSICDMPPCRCLC